MTVLELVSKTNYLNRLINRMKFRYSKTKNIGYKEIADTAYEIKLELENCNITDDKKIKEVLSGTSELYLKGKILDRQERLNKGC